MNRKSPLDGSLTVFSISKTGAINVEAQAYDPHEVLGTFQSTHHADKAP